MAPGLGWIIELGSDAHGLELGLGTPAQYGSNRLELSCYFYVHGLEVESHISPGCVGVSCYVCCLN